jgi:hypothetical protein
MKPTININGTHRDDFVLTYAAATHAVRQALRKLCDIAPHPRDYLTDREWSESNLAHARLVVALDKIRSELEDAEVHIQDQILDGR